MYWDINRPASYDCLFNFILGARGVGKSYGTKDAAIKDYIKKNGLSDEAAIRELENITFYKGADGWRLKDALSKTQREILQQLNLKLRNDAEVNLAMFKQRVRKGKKSKLTDPALFSSLTDVLTGTI